MTRFRLVFLHLLLAVLCLCSTAQAGQNASGVARLSWSRTSLVTNSAPSPGSRPTLYLHLSSVVATNGVEFQLLWAPSGLQEPAYRVTSLEGLASSSSCAIGGLKGTLTKVSDHSDSTAILAVVGSQTSSCQAGPFAYARFDEVGAEALPGHFRLAYVKLLDSQGEEDYLAVVGACSLFSGSTAPPPVVDHYFPAAVWAFPGLPDTKLRWQDSRGGVQWEDAPTVGSSRSRPCGWSLSAA